MLIGLAEGALVEGTEKHKGYLENLTKYNTIRSIIFEQDELNRNLNEHDE